MRVAARKRFEGTAESIPGRSPRATSECPFHNLELTVRQIIRQAIQTKYYPATATKPAKVIAQCAAGRITRSYDDSRNIDENHISAAEALRNGGCQWCVGNRTHSTRRRAPIQEQ